MSHDDESTQHLRTLSERSKLFRRRIYSSK